MPKQKISSHCNDCLEPVDAAVELLFSLPPDPIGTPARSENRSITAIRKGRFPGATSKSLIVTTQTGSIWRYDFDTNIVTEVLNIRSLVLQPIAAPFDAFFESGLTGIELDPDFKHNGIIYITYAIAGSVGSNVVVAVPDQCIPATLNQTWQFAAPANQYDHTIAIEQWQWDSNINTFTKLKRYLQIKSVSFNHQGIDNLRWDYKLDQLVYALGDTSSGTTRGSTLEFIVADPFNLAQNPDFLQGKHWALDVRNWPNIVDPAAVAQYSELIALYPNLQTRLHQLTIGFRNGNAPIAEKATHDQIYYNAVPGHQTLEAVFAFDSYGKNFGWRPIEGGAFPTLTFITTCPQPPPLPAIRRYENTYRAQLLQSEALYDEAHASIVRHLVNLATGPWPLAYISAVPYNGKEIRGLKGTIILGWFQSRNGPAFLPGRLQYFCPNRNCLEERVIPQDINLQNSIGARGQITAMASDICQTKLYLGINDITGANPTSGLRSVYRLIPPQ